MDGFLGSSDLAGFFRVGRSSDFDFFSVLYAAWTLLNKELRSIKHFSSSARSDSGLLIRRSKASKLVL